MMEGSEMQEIKVNDLTPCDFQDFIDKQKRLSLRAASRAEK